MPFAQGYRRLKDIVGVLLMERDWNPNYPEIKLLNIIGNKWIFKWNSNFSGTVILQLWLLSLIPFRHFVFTVKLSEAYPSRFII